MILCCLQVKNAKSFISDRINRKLKLFDEVNCKSSWEVYSMECTLCKRQYFGKVEILLNI